MKLNFKNKTTTYLVQRIIGGVATIVTTSICGFIAIRQHRQERKEQRKEKEKDYDLRNRKDVEREKMLRALDNPDLGADIKIANQQSFQQMLSRPMAKSSGWLVPWYAKKGQISGCVAAADTGKTILMTDCALAAANGTTPTFMPSGAPKADKMDVVYYLLEERAGEFRDRYGNGAIFPANFGWVPKGDLAIQTFDGLIADIEKRADGFNRDTAVFVDPLSRFKNWDLAKFLSAMEDVQDKCAAKGIIVSVLFSAHTEETKAWKPLTPDMVRGGDVVIQQVGALFALRLERGGNGFRFLQTLKVPKGEVEKGTVDVIRFESRKKNQPNSYTHLVYHCQKKESEALPLKTKAETKGEAPQAGGRGRLWTEKDTERLIELASTLETPDKDHIADMMGRTPNMVYKMARMNGIQLMSKPRGRKPKPDEQ